MRPSAPRSPGGSGRRQVRRSSTRREWSRVRRLPEKTRRTANVPGREPREVVSLSNSKSNPPPPRGRRGPRARGGGMSVSGCRRVGQCTSPVSRRFREVVLTVRSSGLGRVDDRTARPRELDSLNRERRPMHFNPARSATPRRRACPDRTARGADLIEGASRCRGGLGAVGVRRVSGADSSRTSSRQCPSGNAGHRRRPGHLEQSATSF